MLAALIVTLVAAVVLALIALWLMHLHILAIDRIQSLEESFARQELELGRVIEVGHAVYPYLAETSVDMFYGEVNGKQSNFAQRQEIADKVGVQNTILRRYENTFGITPTEKARKATGVPKLYGREALDLMSKFGSKEDHGPH